MDIILFFFLTALIIKQNVFVFVCVCMSPLKMANVQECSLVIGKSPHTFFVTLFSDCTKTLCPNSPCCSDAELCVVGFSLSPAYCVGDDPNYIYIYIAKKR